MNVDIKKLGDGRRHIHFRIGSIVVDAVEIPARCLSARDWAVVQLARRSYVAMWGAAAHAEDAFDSRCRSVYDTRHYAAWVKEDGEAGKVVTMRKVRVDPARLPTAQIEQPHAVLPPDIQFWSVRTGDGARLPLWQILKLHARRLAPDESHPEFRIASLSRTGTFPYGTRDRTRRKREHTAIAFAAIQLLAVDVLADLLYVSHLCSEFQERVLGVVDVDGSHVAPAHFKTEEELALPAGSTRMENSLHNVREHKATIPGYFIDNDSARDLIVQLLDSGRVSVTDLRPTVARLVVHERAQGRDKEELAELVCATEAHDHRLMAEALTRPAMFKYMVPRITSGEPLAGMSGPAFRDALIDETEDGPFSSTRSPQDWLDGAHRVLDAAAAKYG